MSRRTAAATCLLLSSVLGACAARPAKRAARPNIVFILADDMGYGDPRCNNPASKIETPCIDALAAQGMRFTDAHAPGSVCVPSRYGLLTGRYPMRMQKMNPGQRAVIDTDRETIASLLRERGYHTGMVGKWHLGFDGGAKGRDYAEPMTGGPVDRGFDTYFGIPASLDIPPYYYIRDRAPVAPPTERVEAKNTDGWTKIQGEFWRAGGIAPGFRHEDVLPRLGVEACGHISARTQERDRPFFLYVALPAPHTPWLPTEMHRGQSAVDLYGDFVSQVDFTVSTILIALERFGFSDDTLVIFSSDNGPVWYPRDVERFGHSSVGPLAGMKGDAWEGGHRMPFVVRWPGRVVPGTVCDQMICFTDMLATFADITGAETPEDVDSVSIVPLLDGGVRPVRDTLVLKHNGSVVREGRWKLITHLGSGGFSKPRRIKPVEGGPTGQLYDLSTDPGETTNLWAERPDVVARLSRLLADERK